MRDIDKFGPVVPSEVMRNGAQRGKAMTVKSSNLTHLYKEWQAGATAEQIAFVDSVFDMCERNYESGGDVVVECYGPSDILAEFKTIEDAKEFCGLHAEQATNCRWGEDSDPEVNKPTWEDVEGQQWEDEMTAMVNRERQAVEAYYALPPE